MYLGQLPAVAPTNLPAESKRIDGPDGRYVSEYDWVQGRIFGGGSSGAAPVTPDTAMNLAAFSICALLKSQDIASLPLKTFERLTDGGRVEARDFDLFRILHRHPNSDQTTMQFVELLNLDRILRGVGRARIVTNGAGRIVELRRMHPDRTRQYRTKAGRTAYEWRDDDDKLHTLDDSEVFKVHGPFGMSMIQYLCHLLSQGIVQEAYNTKFFSNFGRPGGIIQMKQRLQDDVAVKRFKEDWQNQYAGIDNAYKIALLEDGWEWKPTEVKLSDQEALDSRKFNAGTICAGMRVPAHMLNLLDRATFSNIDSQQQSYYIQGLRPDCVAWEQAIERDLLLDSEQDRYYAEFDIDALVRGDLDTRQKYYSAARQNGWYSANDIRRKENENPIGPQGDVYLVQAGYLPANLVAEAKTISDLLSKGGTSATRSAEPEQRIEVNVLNEASKKSISKVVSVSRDANGHLQARMTEEPLEHDDADIHRNGSILPGLRGAAR